MPDVKDSAGRLRSLDPRGRNAPDAGWAQFPASAIVSGTLASIATGSALALLARVEGKTPLQPINATSHWLHGPDAARVRDADLQHTGVGYVTHHASCIFWALPFEWWFSSRSKRTTAEALGGAALVSSIAAAVDYGLLPRRLTPGWEHAVCRESVGLTFGAMALGLAAGGLLAQALRRS